MMKQNNWVPLKLPSAMKGIAVIMALFVVALVSAVVLALLTRESIDITRTRWITQSYTAYFSAQGATRAALNTLKHYVQKSPIDQASIKWPLVIKAPPLKGGEVGVRVWDATDRFNLNNLQDPTMEGIFIRLLLLLDSSLDKEKAMQLTQAIKAQFGLEAKEKPEQKAPILNQGFLIKQPETYLNPIKESAKLVSVSELRLIPEMTAEGLASLAPYVIALPGLSPINVNTASPLLLQSLSENISQSAVSLIVETREDHPYQSIDDFMKRAEMGQKMLPIHLISVSSQYFLIEASVKLQEQTLLLLTLVTIEKADPHHLKLDVLWQSQNTL